MSGHNFGQGKPHPTKCSGHIPKNFGINFVHLRAYTCRHIRTCTSILVTVAINAQQTSIIFLILMCQSVHAGRVEEFTEAQFKRQFPDRAAILDVDGLTHLAIGMDSMHNKHLGMDQYYAGSVLYLLVYVVLHGHQGAHPNKWDVIKS